MTLYGPRPEIEVAILADAVQAVGGKLYVLGGGWDTLFASRFPARHPSLGIGVRIRVPWGSVDEEFRLSVDLLDEDGHSAFGGKSIIQKFRAGRPSGIPDGADVGVVRALTINGLVFPRAGGYSFVVSIDGAEAHRISFRVRERDQT
ncbi:MAG: hypothetical protein GWP04_11095 [Gammaproteobacteria bacterium]|nr:hypothetical protein [Gammaproteobacteria bacterium]